MRPMHLFPKRHLLLTLCGSALLLAAHQGCAPGAPERAEFVPIEVLLPKLDRQEPATRERIEQLHERASSSLDERPFNRPDIAQTFGELGSHLAALGLFESASDAFENARRAEPETFRWHYYLGVSRQDDSKLEPAIAAYSDALGLEPDDVPSRLHRTEALLDLDRVDEAEDTLKPLLDSLAGSEHEAAVRFRLGRIAEARGLFEKAAEELQQVIALQPQSSAAQYPLSQAYLRLGQKERAAEHLSLRGDQKPSFPDPLVAELGSLVSLTSLEVVRSRVSRNDFDPVADLGYTLANLGDIGGAPERMAQIADQDAELKAVPTREARFRYLLGGLWVNRGQDQKAEAQFLHALELDSEITAARVMLGNLQARQGRFDEALHSFSLAVTTDPTLIDAQIKRAAVLSRLGRHAEALHDLDKAAATDPENTDLTARRVALLDRLGRASEAETLLRETLESTRDSPQAAVLHHVAGNRHKADGHFEQAVESYSKALTLSPGLVSAGLDLASVLGHLGRFDQALRAYRDVLGQQPSSADARRGEITVLILTRRYKEAARSLESALANSGPSAADALDWSHSLARILAACPDPDLRDGARAVRLANRVFDAEPSLVRGQTLAMAHAENGDFSQAAVIQRNLITEARRAGRPEIATRLGRDLTLYESGRAFRADHPADLLVSTPSGEGA